MPNDSAAPNPALDFSAIPGHIDHSSIQAPQNPSQAVEHNPDDVAKDYNASQESGIEKLEDVTKPIENYTQEGRAEHPILSKIGDVTRGVKELLGGGQEAGKPLGTSEGLINNPVTQTLGGESMVTEDAPAVLEAAGKIAGKVGSHLAETGKTFGQGLLEEGKAAIAAKAPEGSLEAGFAKIPGYQKITDAPTPQQNVINDVKNINQSRASAKLEERNGKVRIRDLQSKDRSQGHGSALLKGITDSADKHGVHLELTSSPYGDEATRLDHDQLKSFYQRHGFTDEPGYDPALGYMVREPKSSVAETPEPKGPTPNEQVAASAQRYNAANNKPQINHEPVELPSQEERNELADKFSQAKHEPENPAVARSYDAMKKETLDQFNHAKNDLGIKFDFTKEDPYKSAEEMQADVKNNSHLSVYTGGTKLPKDHPLAEIEPSTGESYNSIFRGTHDIFGHAAGGHDFTEAGEENAYNAHKQMYSDEARPAVRNETQGQSNWYFNNDKVRNGGEQGFPEQKATILDKSTNGQKEEEGGDPNLGADEREPEEGDTSFNHGANVKPAWWNEPSENKLAKGMTKGDVITDWLTRHKVPQENGKYVFYHATPAEGGASDSLRAGSYLAEDQETAHHQASREYGSKSKQIKVTKVLVNPEDIHTGIWATLRNDIPIAKWDETKPAAEFEKTSTPTSDAPISNDNAYHPDLQKLIDKYGVEDDPYKIGNGKSFITHDGKFIHINSLDHNQAIEAATGRKGSDNRIDFLNDTGAIRTNFEPFGRAGRTFTASVPKQGVSEEQIRALKEATYKAVGKNGNIVLERADITPETKDKLSNTKEFGNANHIEQMLRDIDAHPGPKPWMEAAAEKARTGGGFTTHPTTGEVPTEGQVGEISPEHRVDLGHTPTAEDIQKFTKDNKALLDKHPELHVGGFGNELNISAVGKNAYKVAKKLDQRSIYDLGKDEEFHTGGTGQRRDFPNYSMEDRLKDIAGKPMSDIPGFESLSKDIHLNLEPDERKYLKDNNRIQSEVMRHYHAINPSVPETTNAMQAGAALGGWWQRFIDVFHNLGDGGEQVAGMIGPSHTEVLKQWHSALSANKKVEDANNLAWHSYADWLDAGKPTDRKSIDAIVRKNGAQPFGSGKKGNTAVSDTIKRGKVVSEGLDTSKLFDLVNSPEMKGQKPFHGDVFDKDNPHALANKGEGARKLPSMGATVAGKGNLNRLVIDAHINDYYGQSPSGPAARYIADSVHLRQAAKALGLKGGEGQEQLWGTVLGLKTLLKEGLTPAEASGKLNADVINSIGKDYAEVIANDPEITKPGGVLDRLKQQHGVGKGSAGISEANIKTPSASASASGPGSSQEGIDKTQLEKTAGRIREQISPSKIKGAAKSNKKASINALDFLKGF